MIRAVAFDCDTPGCYAYCQISARAVASAFGMAVEKYGWSQRDGKHYCGPCTRGVRPGTVVDLAAQPLAPYYDSEEADRG